MTETSLPFEIRWHQPTQQDWLYVSAGSDPQDGQPLTMARPATEREKLLWARRDYAGIAEILEGQGIPIHYRKPRKWSRFLRRLWRDEHR